MGSAQSFLPAAVFVAGAVVYGYTQLQKPVAVPQPAPSSSSAPSASSSKKQKSKKKAAAQGADASALTEQEKADSARASAVDPYVVAFPPVVPGGFDAPAPAPTLPEPAERPKPKKKKKAKKTGGAAADAQSESSATAPESSAVAASRAKGKRGGAEAGSLDDGWTKVEAKKTARAQQKASGSGAPQLEVSTSDAGVTTSVTGTGNSSPVTERTEDSQLADSATLENRRTLAEKLLPKPRKTGVEEYVLICSHRRCLSVQNASETIGASCPGNSGAHSERLLPLR